MHLIGSYPSGAVYLRTGVKHIPHAPESKEKETKCYEEVQAMGCVSGSSVVEMVMVGGGGREEHCRQRETHEQCPVTKGHVCITGSGSCLSLRSGLVALLPFSCY